MNLLLKLLLSTRLLAQAIAPGEHEIAPKQTDEYTLHIDAGQFVRIVAEQDGVDVILAIADPQGKTVVEADRPNGDYGPEAASFIAETTGDYRVRIADNDTKKGRYKLHAVELHAPTDTDRKRIDAERATFAANRENKPDSYEHARALWHEVHDPYEEALCADNAASGYLKLGDRKKALDEYLLTAPLYHELGFRLAEADTLNSIGNIYYAFKDKPKALDVYTRSLDLYRGTTNRSSAAAVLDNLGSVYEDLGQREKAIAYFTEALPIFHELRNHPAELVVLLDLARVYKAAGDWRKELDVHSQALPLERELKDTAKESDTLYRLGLIHNDTGDQTKALAEFTAAREIFHQAKNKAKEADCNYEIAAAHDRLGHKKEAIDSYTRALDSYRVLGDNVAVAQTLASLGVAFNALGLKQRALENYNQALPILHDAKELGSEGAVLSNMASVYDDLGENQKALDYDARALPLRQAAGDKNGVAITLNNIGLVYSHLGDYKKSLDYYSRALEAIRATGDRFGEAAATNNVGRAYQELGDNAKARDYFERALVLRRAVSDPIGEASTLNNLAGVYQDQGDKKRALEYYLAALPLNRKTGDLDGEALSLNNIGHLYDTIGDQRQALDYYVQALPITRAIGSRSDEATTLHNMSYIFEKTQPEMAILLEKQSVNILQTMRRDNRNLEPSVLKAYEKSIESYYRRLAGLLVGRSRFGEAEEVLNLLKDHEAVEFAQRDAVTDRLKAATLLDPERKALDRYEQVVSKIVSEGQQKSALVAKAAKAELTAEENQLSKLLDQDLAAANIVLARYFSEEEKSFASTSGAAKRVTEMRESEGLQDALQSLGANVVAIYTLVLPDRYTALLVTSSARKAYSTKISEADLNRKIFEFRQKLQNPNSDPLPLAQDLYRILFPEGLRADLESMNARTIMWSIDSTIRYIPIAALHDGKQYLVARFCNSLITPASLTRLTESSPAAWKGVGFGVSQAKGNFSALPSVPDELGRIFQKEGAPVPGKVELDGEFTRDAFEAAMRQPQKSVVHIATHFDSRPGTAANSHLLLGDGTQLSLAEIEATPRLFSGVDLLTLSACSTAFTNGTEDGREVDSFGTIAQRLGARGVIASLWSVNDEATARLMETMYRLRQSKPELGKSEALREAQRQMQSGELKAGADAPARGVQTPTTPNHPSSWTHPYYWAPFILIGNWK